MMGLTKLLASERGVFALVALALATVFVILRLMPVEAWAAYSLSLSALLITSKTVTGWRDRKAVPEARTLDERLGSTSST